MRANLAPTVDPIDRLPVPVPSAPLRLVGDLSDAARSAIATDPAEIIRHNLTRVRLRDWVAVGRRRRTTAEQHLAIHFEPLGWDGIDC